MDEKRPPGGGQEGGKMIDFDFLFRLFAFGFSCFAFGFTTCNRMNVYRMTDKLLKKSHKSNEHRDERDDV